MKINYNWAAILIGSFFIFLSISLQSLKQHNCQWENCPYKGAKQSEWHNAVVEYSGEDGTDAYCVDMLHLKYPKYLYEVLDWILFTNQQKPTIAKYIEHLDGEGYGEKWAKHRALVEFGEIPADELYQSIMED